VALFKQEAVPQSDSYSQVRGKKILKVVPLPVPYRSDVPRPPFVGEERFKIVELGFLVHPADGSGHRKHYIGARTRLIHAVGNASSGLTSSISIVRVPCGT
jgi:hypothetical protein